MDQPAWPLFLPQGDTGLLVRLGQGIEPGLNAQVRGLAQALEAAPLPGVREIITAYDCLLVHLDPLALEPREVEAWVRQAWQEGGPPEPVPGPRREVPVVYGGLAGPDLEEVARLRGLTPREVVERHAGREYLCYLVGFTPGFPFLGGLDPALACPRLASPRPALPPGSVGLAGSQSGLYPLGGPGGWRILGRTPLGLYDPSQAQPCLIQAGDRVRFIPIPRAEFPPPLSARQEWQAPGRPVLEVLAPGAQSTVQDLGRPGQGRWGLPISGALDQYALQVANALLGNDPGAAALEMTLLGPKLRVLAPTRVAVCGGDLGLRLDGRPAPTWTALELAPGQVLAFAGPRQGARALLAVAGGLAARPLLGSRSCYALGCLGAPLRAGDILQALEVPCAPALPVLPPELRPGLGDELVIRVMLGPSRQCFGPAGEAVLLEGAYAVGQRADRRGLVLEGPAVPSLAQAAMVSEPLTPGVIQVPPDGQPIILLREQTVGGYPKVATVISADLDKLAQARPGQGLRFQAVDLAQARQAAQRLSEARRALSGG